MQPDTKQAAPDLSMQDASPTEVPAVEEQVQAPPAPVAAPVAVAPAAQPKKKFPIVRVLTGIFIFMLLAALAGVGFWAYTLNSRLTATRQDLSTLQGQYGQLKSEKAGVDGELAQTKADLEKTQADLTTAQTDLSTAQADLKKEQEKSKGLETKISKTQKMVAVAAAIFVSPQNTFGIKNKVSAVGDPHLTELFDRMTASRNQSEVTKSLMEFLVYLFQAMEDELK